MESLGDREEQTKTRKVLEPGDEAGTKTLALPGFARFAPSTASGLLSTAEE